MNEITERYIEDIINFHEKLNRAEGIRFASQFLREKAAELFLDESDSDAIILRAASRELHKLAVDADVNARQNYYALSQNAWKVLDDHIQGEKYEMENNNGTI